ncbi:MAG: hypothetical protein JOZ10_05090 [Acidobacteria bacterium]|nr:hypothetical protein [Acidobacteriota bacterium]
MKKSARVDLGIIAALALSLTGCHSNEMQRCVDDRNVVSPDEFCSPTFTSRYHWGADPATGQRHCLDSNNMPVNDVACTSTVGRHYHWYYGGRGSYAPGSVATQGSEFPRAGGRYATYTEAHSGSSSGSGAGHDGTSRGGFGHAGSGGRAS